MCGPPYDREHGVPNINNEYTIKCRLNKLHDYRVNGRGGETEKEYFKRINKENKNV